MKRAFTGNSDELIHELNQDLHNATSIKIIVAFIRESGVRAISLAISQALEKGATIKILTGTYLSITEPSALYLIKDLFNERVQLKIFSNPNQSFHPKGYLIQNQNEKHIYIGSSNLSKSGLMHGIEWNYKINGLIDPDAIDLFETEFDYLFASKAVTANEEILRSYSLTWKVTEINKHFNKSSVQYDDDLSLHGKVSETKSFQDFESQNHNTKLLQIQPKSIYPRGAQIEALYALSKAREEGIERGLIIAATGVGKTYISAFDVERMKVKRTLFVAHRDEILIQAMQSYKLANPGKSSCLFSGNMKDNSADMVFASVQTLGKDEYLNSNYFNKEDFEHITIDEFHHAAAGQYRKILDYFQPKFLLGLTATPYRMDNQDIFKLCDDNIIYEIDLNQSINRGLLSPYKYYAIYDETDYKKADIINGSYDIKSLEKLYSVNYRKELILEKYRSFAGNHTIAFCASIKHAKKMAQYFNSKKISSIAVHSQMDVSDQITRKECISKFQDGEYRVLFVVDIFNEGIDIPQIDTVLFLRPTESYVIFLQQLGRGLRLSEKKAYLTILDFIGNYKRAHYKPLILSGLNPMDLKGKRINLHQIIPPENCHIHFDLRLINLFDELTKTDPKPIRLRDEFKRIQMETGRRPMRYDLLVGSDIDYREYIKNGYLRYLDSQNLLDNEELHWINTPVEEMLIRIEKTSMVRSYKLPILSVVFENNGHADYGQIIDSFESYYNSTILRKNDLIRANQLPFEEWNKAKLLRHALNNPVHFLAQSENSFFKHDEINKQIFLAEEIMPFMSEKLLVHVQDILKVRESQYFSRKYFNEGKHHDDK